MFVSIVFPVFSFSTKIVTKQLWYFTSDNINLIAITLSKILKKKRKKEKRKIGLEWNRNVHLTPFYISASARVFGYTVYRGFLNRVYGILQLKYGIRYITFFEFQV